MRLAPPSLSAEERMDAADFGLTQVSYIRIVSTISTAEILM